MVLLLLALARRMEFLSRFVLLLFLFLLFTVVLFIVILVLFVFRFLRKSQYI